MGQVLKRLLLLAAVAATLYAEDFSGKVVAITDGDTIKVMHMMARPSASACGDARDGRWCDWEALGVRDLDAVWEVLSEDAKERRSNEVIK